MNIALPSASGGRRVAKMRRQWPESGQLRSIKASVVPGSATFTSTSSAVAGCIAARTSQSPSSTAVSILA
eukprot:scaffold22029_cov117-Isochrysis_galbana.AAC.2